MQEPKITIMAGKGGAGKSTCAVALAAYYARVGRKVVLVDYDGGHSVGGTLGIDITMQNKLAEVAPGLDAIVIESRGFTDILSAHAQQMSTAAYLGQFKEDEGIVPYADMASSLFGVPSDPAAVQKFAILVNTLHSLKARGYEEIIIDVEPTAGLQRLLSNASVMARSLSNLHNVGKVKLLALAHIWPDVAEYLKGEYIADIEHYMQRVIEATEYLRLAYYFLVCMPEMVPVEQTFAVRTIIENYGARVMCCIATNVRNEPQEGKAVAVLANHYLPVVALNRSPKLHSDLAGERLEALIAMGETIGAFFPYEHE